MAPAKLYAAVDFGGPFLDWLLEHFRRKQKAGDGLDLHLQAENPEDKVSLHQVETFTNIGCSACRTLRALAGDGGASIQANW